MTTTTTSISTAKPKRPALTAALNIAGTIAYKFLKWTTLFMLAFYATLCGGILGLYRADYTYEAISSGYLGKAVEAQLTGATISLLVLFIILFIVDSFLTLRRRAKAKK